MATSRTQTKAGKTKGKGFGTPNATTNRAKSGRRGTANTTNTSNTSSATSDVSSRSSNRGSTSRPPRGDTGFTPNERQVEELVLQALETELGGVQVYETALRCATNEDLREEWGEYLEQTQHHVEVVQNLCLELGIDTEKETPGRAIVRHLGEGLVKAMEMALKDTPGEAAQVVAAECVVLAETKDHLNWSLMGEIVKAADDETKQAFEAAYDEVEDQEDEHLYHTIGWCRELWLQSLGLEAVLPPPEEKKDVKSAIGAAKAKASRKSMISKRK